MSYYFAYNQVICFWHVYSCKWNDPYSVVKNFRNTYTCRNNSISFLVDILFWSKGSSCYNVASNYVPSFCFHHFATSTEAEPFVIDPNLSITFALAAAGISSITLREPLACHSSFFKDPTDFKTEKDCAANCAGTRISRSMFSDFNGIIDRSCSTMSFVCSSTFLNGSTDTRVSSMACSI